MSLPPLPTDEDTESFRRPRQPSEPPTGEVAINGQRIQIPPIPPWGWMLIAALSGGTGTTVGSVLSVDWFGISASTEAQELRIQMLETKHAYELELIKCGCSTTERPNE